MVTFCGNSVDACSETRCKTFQECKDTLTFSVVWIHPDSRQLHQRICTNKSSTKFTKLHQLL